MAFGTIKVDTITTSTKTMTMDNVVSHDGSGNIIPSTNNTANLGSPSFRFANVYTGDLHLKNDRGDWTLIEEEDALTLRNNKTGKVFDIVMKERNA